MPATDAVKTSSQPLPGFSRFELQLQERRLRVEGGLSCVRIHLAIVRLVRHRTAVERRLAIAPRAHGAAVAAPWRTQGRARPVAAIASIISRPSPVSASEAGSGIAAADPVTTLSKA